MKVMERIGRLPAGSVVEVKFGEEGSNVFYWIGGSYGSQNTLHLRDGDSFEHYWVEQKATDMTILFQPQFTDDVSDPDGIFYEEDEDDYDEDDDY